MTSFVALILVVVVFFLLAFLFFNGNMLAYFFARGEVESCQSSVIAMSAYNENSGWFKHFHSGFVNLKCPSKDVVFYVEQLLRQALFTNLQSWYKPQAQLTELIVNMLYIGLPALWTLLLGWIGVKGGQGLGGIVGQMSLPASAGGNAAGSIANTAVNKRL